MPLLTINGQTLNYEEAGAGDPFVYLAYTRFDSAAYLKDYMAKHGTGFRVILPDARGMGKSVHVPMIEPRDWVDDLLGMLDALELSQIHLASETLGSRVATRFAADYPERVKTLILNGAIAYSSPEGDKARHASADPANLPAPRRELMQKLHGDDWEAVNLFYQALHEREDFKSYYDLREIAPRVQAPTLVMRGDIDEPVHPLGHSVAVHQRLANSWLAIYPNSEFNAMRAHPTETWALIREFIQTKG
ncbi:MAG: alpha/beta fold hydrolase [Chloroflexota bacterium]